MDFLLGATQAAAEVGRASNRRKQEQQPNVKQEASNDEKLTNSIGKSFSMRNIFSSAPKKPSNKSNTVKREQSNDEKLTNNIGKSFSMRNIFSSAPKKQEPVKPENIKVELKPNTTRKASATKANITNSTINATILWKGSYMDLTMNENKDCNEITQYLDTNKTSAFIYKMNKAEVEKATKNKGKDEWIAVICYLASDGKQVNMPITKTTLLRTDLYDVLRRKNKQITTITSSTMNGGKNRNRSVKKNKRSTRRNRKYRK